MIRQSIIVLALLGNPGSLDKFGGHIGPEQPGEKNTYHCHECPCGCTEVMKPKEKKKDKKPDSEKKDSKDNSANENSTIKQTPPWQKKKPPPSPYAERRASVQRVRTANRLRLTDGEIVYLVGVIAPAAKSRNPTERENAEVARKEAYRLVNRKEVVLQIEKGRAPSMDLPDNAIEAYVQVSISLRILSLDGQEEETREIPTDLGEHLIGKGLVRADEEAHYKRKSKYIEAQKRAQKARLGIWKH